MAAVSPLAALAACAVGPDYAAPKPGVLDVPDRFAAAAPDFASPASAEELAQWWTGMGDTILDGMIQDALAQGPDVIAAAARLRQARGALKTTGAALLPALNATGSVGHTELLGSGRNAIIAAPGAGSTGSSLFGGGSQTSYNARLDAAYEVDIFGGVRRSVEAARGDETRAYEALRDMQRTTVAEVAVSYVSARSAQERLAIARSNLKSQDGTVQIAGWRAQAGLVSSLDVAQARAQREQTAATIPTLETSLVQSASALAVLTGHNPGEIEARLADPQPVPQADRMLGADVPVDVLARRPDVRAAERALAAATARIGVNKADLYPALRLSGTLGGNGTSVGDITKYSTGTLLAAVTAPIFDGGAIRGRIDSARGSSDEALANYRKAVLTALGDVENAMTALANTREREVSLSLAVDQSQNALLYAQSQYRAGIVDFQTLLDSERTLLSSEDGAAQARADRATALITLYKALGGGWQAAPMPANAMPKTPAAIELPDLAATEAPPADPAKPNEKP